MSKTEAELDPQLSQESTHAQLEEEGGANSNIIFLGPGCLGLAYKQGGWQKYKQSKTRLLHSVKNLYIVSCA